jgi:hypothetical protein
LILLDLLAFLHLKKSIPETPLYEKYQECDEVRYFSFDKKIFSSYNRIVIWPGDITLQKKNLQ